MKILYNGYIYEGDGWGDSSFYDDAFDELDRLGQLDALARERASGKETTTTEKRKASPITVARKPKRIRRDRLDTILRLSDEADLDDRISGIN